MRRLHLNAAGQSFKNPIIMYKANNHTKKKKNRVRYVVCSALILGKKLAKQVLHLAFL